MITLFEQVMVLIRDLKSKTWIRIIILVTSDDDLAGYRKLPAS